MLISAHKKLQIIKKVLKEGKSVSQVCKEAGIARKTFYQWKKRYLKAPNRVKKQALEPKYTSGKDHPKNKRHKFKDRLIQIVICHPSWGSRKISAILCKLGFGLSNHAIYNLLKDLNLGTKNQREEFSSLYQRFAKIKRAYAPKPLRLTPETRKRVIEEVEILGKSVTSVCKKYYIVRKTFYKWLRRYHEAREKETVLMKAMEDNYVEGFAHPRSITYELQERILYIVKQHPEYSTHKVAQMLAEVGNHGVQNVFERLDFNTYEKRLAYAKAYRPVMAPVTGILDCIKPILGRIPKISAIPPPTPLIEWLRRAGPPSREKFASLVKPFFLALFSSIFLSSLFVFFLRAISQAPTASVQIGLFFALIALTVGSFFFAYSMKYYLTLALVLSFSRESTEEGGMRVGISLGASEEAGGGNLIKRIFGLASESGSSFFLSKLGATGSKGGLLPSLDNVKLKRYPFVSIHLPLYNEKKVVERLLDACTAMDYPSTRGSTGPSATSSGPSGSPLRSGQVPQANYEIIVCDDSTDETTEIAKQFLRENYGKLRFIKDDEGNEIYKTSLINPNKPPVTLIHRASRLGFKGGALRKALGYMDPRTEFVAIFDADFVPYPDTLELFVKNFKASNQGSEEYTKSKIAVVGGYQWHVLNKSENWITRGIRSEYAGSYVIERSGQELLGALKMISGSVYMIRADVLAKIGWGTSITEDFQLTLRLYAQGYKVVYTPYVQAPAECVSTLKRLIRQRMRWAEGHSNNIRRMFRRLMFGRWSDGGDIALKGKNVKGQMSNVKFYGRSKKVWVKSPLTVMEKLEFLYLSPYYLQAAFFLMGTFSWLLAETVFRAKLPFWTSLWGWSLVLTNLLSLPLMNAVGLFLEESEEKDYLGILSFMILSYVLVPFQAYASVKGFLEKQEGPWFRTPKTGLITDIFTRGRFYRWILGILPGRHPAVAVQQSFATGELAFDLHPYLALATANNRFHSFELKPKRNRLIGKIALFLVVGLSSIFSYFGNRVPQGAITNFPIQARVEVQRQDSSLLSQAVNMFKPKEVFAQSFVAEKFFDPKTISEAKGTILVLFLLLSLGLFPSFVRRKRRFVVRMAWPLFLFLLITSWLLASWPGLSLINFPPKVKTVEAAYDDVVLGTNGGPSYRLKLDGDLVEDIVGITVTGAPNSYVSTIIPQDSGQCGEYSAAQETVLANQTNVNSATTYRKAVSFWVTIDTFGTGTGSTSRLLWEEGGATNWWSAYTSNNDELRISIGESGADVGNCVASGLSTGTLYHVVMQWEASTENMELWINGNLADNTTTSTAGALSSHTGDWEIAGVSDAFDHTAVAIGLQFDGKIADYAYWAEPSRLLTQSEIEAIYNAGVNLSPSAPTLNNVPFNNEMTGDSTPNLEFSALDPDGTASIIYHIEVDDDYAFGSMLINCESDTSCAAGSGSFINTVNGGDTNPFNEGELIRFTPTTAMTDDVTYYWRVRAEDDSVSGGSGEYGDWSGIQSVTYNSGKGLSEWFQTTDEQFDTGMLSSTQTSGSDSVELGGNETTVYLTSGTTWDVPSDWNSSDNSIEAIGAGGNGGVGTDSSNSGAGGGGGEYRKATNVSLTASSTVNINIPSGGAGSAADGAWLKNNADTKIVEAKNGGNASGVTAGSGGTGGIGSADNDDGGAGGAGASHATCASGGGGGGSAGPTGIGKQGGDGKGNTNWGGGGGGGSNGGLSTPGVTPPTNNSVGGDGGDGTDGTGHGTGGTAKNSNNATAGTVGGGGGGGSQSTGSTPALGAAGGTEDLWATGVGPSGGGGGGGGCGGTGCTVSHIGGTGGTYGGGGGGCGFSGTNAAANCPSTPVGGQGIIVVTYTADASSGTIMSTEIDYDWFTGASAWNDVYWTENETHGTIMVQVYYNDCGTIIPDGDFSGCSASNNSTGFTTSPVDISCLSTSTYNEICLRATLADSGGTPYLEDWGVSVPENPLLLFGFGSFVLGFIKKLKRRDKWF